MTRPPGRCNEQLDGDCKTVADGSTKVLHWIPKVGIPTWEEP